MNMNDYFFLKPKIFYWFVPVASIILQTLFSINSLSQIRYDELAESIRNVFWLQNGLLYDGTSSNVGFYGPLLFIYNLFGFDIHTAKYFRLFLHAVSMFCATAIFYRWLGPKKGILPLLVISFSPTLLYMNTLQSSLGIDLQYFPIVLFLIYFLNLKKKILSLSMQFLAGTLSMVAWMSYPAFIFYLPFLGIIYLRKLKDGNQLQPLLAGITGFVWPFLAAFVYLKDRMNFLYDPISGSGVFRAAGSFSPSGDVMAASLLGFFRDLFLKPDSYQMELFKGEFSDIYPILPVAAVLIISLRLIKLNQSKTPFWVFVLMVITIILPSLTFDPSGRPGIRRATAFLAFFYLLFTFAWKWLSSQKNNLILKGALVLLLVHHIIVYPVNLMHLKDPIADNYPLWFSSYEEKPREALQGLVTTVQKEDLDLVCFDELKRPLYCRYSEIYAAVSGFCHWNKLSCHQIKGYDFKTDQMIPLNVNLWKEYYFEH